jgi:hypothetical protein
MAVLILVVAASVPVFAHEADEHAAETAQPSTLADRVAKRKADLKTKLTTVQQKRVQSRCKNAQTLLKVTIEKAEKIQTNRDKIHTDLLNKLTNLETKLAASGVDTTELKAQIADLQTKVDTFKTDSAAYIQAAQDTAATDCQADPVAFKASLEAARASLKKLQTDAVAIRTSFAQQIKPQLADAKSKLETQKEAN